MKRGILTAAFLLCLAVPASVSHAAQLAEDTIAEGVYIEDMDMSGMMVSEAIEAVDSYVKGRMDTMIRLNIEDNWVEVSASDMGLSCEDANVVEEAFEYGKEGNIVQRYKIMKDLQQEPHVFSLQFQVDEDTIRSIVEEKCTVYDVEAEDATVTREGGSFEITPGTKGIKLNVDASVEKIVETMSGWDGTGISIDLVCEVEEPRGTEEDFAQVKDVLGTFTTSFSSSGANRTKNVTTGAEKIDGTVVYPGETVSVYELTQPYTEENGYATAVAYENGREVDSVGGGICQVSTTLYNAVLKAELEVVERANHSMIVGYVDPSMDAAIAGTYKDLKFKNSTDAPIYIEGYVENKKITFTIYGHETRDTENRKVTYESEVLETTAPTPALVYVADAAQPVGYKVVTKSAHTGYKARLWKIVTVNGVEESREVINNSTYNASPAYCSVGTMWADPNVTAAVEAAIATQDNATIDATIAPYAAQLAALQAQQAAQ